MPEYPQNYHGYKEEQKAKKEKKLERVISGPVQTRKKSEFRKLIDTFIGDDIHSIKSYIFKDVLVPTIKKAIDEIISNGTHMLLYNGEVRTTGRSNVSKISYNSISTQNRGTSLRAEQARTGIEYDDILFTTRGDAEAVLSTMDEVLDQFGIISVLDMYDLAGYSTNNYTLERYGWNDIHTAKVVRVPEGYIIQLPRAVPINSIK